MKMKITNRNIYQNIIIFFLVSFLFQYCLELRISSINYFDEIFAIMILVFYLCKKTLQLKKQDFYYLILILVFAFFGILSNFIIGICTSLFPIAVDCFSIVKIYIVYLVIYHLTSQNTAKNILKMLYPIACVYIIVSFVAFIFGNILNINFFFKDENEIRYGIRAFSFIAANAGNFGYLISGLFLIIQYFGKNDIKNKILKIMSLFLLLMTTKGPQILFVSIWIVFMLLRTNKVKIWHVTIVGVLGLVLGRYQIIKYFLNTESARYRLLSASMKIAKEHFPFGTGFATFGSEMSRRYYSPLYDKYGLNMIYGLSKEFSVYITDNYWPMLLAQTGYIGTLFIGLILFFIFKDINNSSFDNNNIKVALLTIYIVFLVGSLGAAYYNTATGMFCFTIIALILKNGYILRKDRDEI